MSIAFVLGVRRNVIYLSLVNGGACSPLRSRRLDQSTEGLVGCSLVFELCCKRANFLQKRLRYRRSGHTISRLRGIPTGNTLVRLDRRWKMGFRSRLCKGIGIFIALPPPSNIYRIILVLLLLWRDEYRGLLVCFLLLIAFDFDLPFITITTFNIFYLLLL